MKRWTVDRSGEIHHRFYDHPHCKDDTRYHITPTNPIARNKLHHGLTLTWRSEKKSYKLSKRKSTSAKQKIDALVQKEEVRVRKQEKEEQRIQDEA